MPRQHRRKLAAALAANAARVAVFEPVSFGAVSTLISLSSLLPALLLPITQRDRQRRWRNAFWCWLVPAAPLMFLWDAAVGCLRQWSRREWESALQPIESASRRAQIAIGLHSQRVVW